MAKTNQVWNLYIDWRDYTTFDGSHLGLLDAF